MHLYFFVRGKFEQVELWKCHAQVAYWKFRRINQKTKKEETILVQGALRPSIFGAYEYIFPKEALAEVCSFLGIVPTTGRLTSLSSFNMNTAFKQFSGRAKMTFIRKLFGCRNIPRKILKKSREIPLTFSTEEFERGASNARIPGVCLHVIGIKEDRKAIIGEYYQEGL